MYNEVLIDCANLALFGLDDAIVWPVLGAVVGGVVNFVGNLINSNTTKKTNKANIDATKEENQLAREHEETMYNTYESIPAQAQQYLEAGLNPVQAVSPQSIGHAATSPMPQSQAPQYGKALIDSFPAFLEAGTTLRQQRIQRQEEINKELQNWKQSFENGTAEEQYNLLKEEINSRVALTRADKRKRDKEIEQLDLTYRMAKEAYDSGINSFKDAHEESVALVNKIKAEIKTLNARTDLTKSQKEGVDFANNLSKLYDEKFMDLDYNFRKQQVDEYLAKADKRLEMFDWTYELANHQYLIQQLQDQYDRDIWMSVVDLLKEGKDKGKIFKKISGILAGYFARNPQAALSSMTQLIQGLSPDITIRNSKNNTNVLYN